MGYAGNVRRCNFKSKGIQEELALTFSGPQLASVWSKDKKGHIRERILEISADVAYMDKVAAQGAEKARESASRTIKEVRKIIGFK